MLLTLYGSWRTASDNVLRDKVLEIATEILIFKT